MVFNAIAAVNCGTHCLYLSRFYLVFAEQVKLLIFLTLCHSRPPVLKLYLPLIQWMYRATYGVIGFTKESHFGLMIGAILVYCALGFAAHTVCVCANRVIIGLYPLVGVEH